MAKTVTIYPYLSGYVGWGGALSDSGYRASSLIAWPIARQGTGTRSLDLDGRIAAQVFTLGGQYRYQVQQLGLEYSLATIPAAAYLDTATFYLAIHEKWVSGSYDLACLLYDFGATYGSDDFIPGSALGDYPRLATMNEDDIVLDTPVAMTMDGTTLLDLIKTPEGRAALPLLRVVFYYERQKSTSPPAGNHVVGLATSGSYPTWTHLSKLEVTYSGYQIVTQAEMHCRSVSTGGQVTSEAEAEFEARCRLRSQKAPTSTEVKAYSATKEYRGLLPAERVAISERLDGADSIDISLPYRYQRADGTPDERSEMITGGWYVETAGHWYRIQDFKPDVYQNKLPVPGLSAESELERYFTNYSPVPFSMVGTPSEIMAAVLGGQPEHDWYNGDFAELDFEGFPVGWTDNSGTWTPHPTGTPDIRATAFEENAAELESFGLNHTAGAEIKPLFWYWIAGDFVGSIKAVLSWTNAAGVESEADTLEVDYDQAEKWTAFVAPAWLRVRNEKCVLKLQVSDNSAGSEVRFRRVRFRQNEPATGWTYRGTMDRRSTTVPYTDAALQFYGQWTMDHLESLVYSETAGDVLGRVFTGDEITVNFAAGGAGAKADVLIDGEEKVTGLSVAEATSFYVADLDRHRSHILEVRVNALKVALLGLTQTPENLLAVTWNHLNVYDALMQLKTLVGGEYFFDTATSAIYHDASQGDDATALSLGWLREGHNLVHFVPHTQLSEVENRGYVYGAGDGAFQLSVRMDSTSESQDLYGVQRFVHINRSIRDLPSLVAEAQSVVEARPLPQTTYEATVLRDAAACLYAGDTIQVTHQILVTEEDPTGTRKLRITQIDWRSDSQEVRLLLGDRLKTIDPAATDELVRRKVEQLLRAY